MQFPAPFVVGASRSGTTLLRVMLDSHPELAIPSETHFLNQIVRARDPISVESVVELCITTASWPNLNIGIGAVAAALSALPSFSVTAALREIYRLSAERAGKVRWGDKTPSYLAIMPAIQDLLPEARFIHVIRDGRDVALSLRDLWWGPGKDIRAAANFWVEEITRARSDAAKLAHYVEIRYEDLVRNPTCCLELVADFIDLPFDPAMLSYMSNAERRLQEVVQPFGPNGAGQMEIETFRSIYANTTKPLDQSRLGGWRTRMTRDERRRFEEVASDLLHELGYETLEG